MFESYAMMPKHYHLLTVAAVLLTLPYAAFSQSADKLCQQGLSSEATKMTLTWDSFNMFGNRKESFVETGYTQSGEGSSCKITSKRDTGKTIERSCTWNLRMSCDLLLGQEPITHNFVSGSNQRGKIQWLRNEMMPITVKRGSATTTESREVAVITFVGLWRNGSNIGDSISTIHYDRKWGVMLKADGAHDANKWGDTVTLVEIAP